MAQYKKIMKPTRKVIIKTIIYALLVSTFCTSNNSISWEQILTIKFWALVFITIPPIYCVEQIYSDSEALRSEKRMLSLIVVLVWFLVLGIICMISYFVFDYDILQKL